MYVVPGVTYIYVCSSERTSMCVQTHNRNTFSVLVCIYSRIPSIYVFLKNCFSMLPCRFQHMSESIHDLRLPLWLTNVVRTACSRYILLCSTAYRMFPTKNLIHNNIPHFYLSLSRLCCAALFLLCRVPFFSSSMCGCALETLGVLKNKNDTFDENMRTTISRRKKKKRREAERQRENDVDEFVVHSSISKWPKLIDDLFLTVWKQTHYSFSSSLSLSFYLFDTIHQQAGISFSLVLTWTHFMNNNNNDNSSNWKTNDE